MDENEIKLIKCEEQRQLLLAKITYIGALDEFVEELEHVEEMIARLQWMIDITKEYNRKVAIHGVMGVLRQGIADLDELLLQNGKKN